MSSLRSIVSALAALSVSYSGVNKTYDGSTTASVTTSDNRITGDLLEITPPEGGQTWYLPFTREAVPEVRIAERVVVAVKPNEVE